MTGTSGPTGTTGTTGTWNALAIAILLLVPGILAAQSQAPQAPNAVISGVVVDGSSGAPVAGAVVFLAAVPSKPIGPQTRQVTDERGRFAFVNLPGDTDYTIASSKFGYLDGGYGRDVLPTDSLKIVSLKPGAWVANIRATVWKPGIISGTVRDESGEPVAGILVRVLAKAQIYGRTDVIAGPLAVTNDLGEYRFAGLAPGRYLVQIPSVQASVPANTTLAPNRTSAPDGAIELDDTNRLVISRYPLPPPPMNGRQMAYPIAFHPSTSAVDQATVVDLRYGDDKPNIDITLSPVTTSRVSGTVVGPPEALVGLTLRLLPAGLENLGLGSEMATALARSDGSFTFLNVPAGSYVIDAPNSVSDLTIVPRAFGAPGLPMPPGREGSGSSSDTIGLLPGVSNYRTTFRGTSSAYSGRLPVTVATAEVTGLTLRLRPHVSMSGRIIVEPDPAQPGVKPPSRFPIRLDPATGEAYLGWPSSAFDVEAPAFAVNDIPPGQFFVRSFGYPAWMVKSVSWKSRDMTSVPFDTATNDELSGIVVTMTNAVPVLSGTLRDGDDLKRDAVVVVAFPVDRAKWKNAGLWPDRMKTATIASDGTYRLNTLPAGDYLVAAISQAHIATWTDPAFLARIERIASRVTLTWAGTTSQDLTPTVVR